MHRTIVILLVALAGLLLPLALGMEVVQAGAGTYRPDTIGVEDIKPGMKGYGLTVFEGTEPERFDVEVIDVLRNFRPRQDLILVKTHHPRLEVAKVVAGMSGSPIYLNGKMAGAYAYGWTFGAEPVAGVTPIANMIAELERPLPKSIYGWPLGVSGGKQVALSERGARRERFAGDARHYDVGEHARQLRRGHGRQPGPATTTAVATPLLMGGMTPDALEAARDLFAGLGLEPLQAGGGGGIDPSAPSRYVDGGAIGVQLIRGDISATGLGTVTRVEGDRLVAFGHPMMQAGVTAIPTAVGRVLWFLASDMRSFKIGMPVRPVGAMVNDRSASIVVSHSAKAPVVPVTLRLMGMPGVAQDTWRFEVAHEKFMTPSFLSVALGNALQAVAAERQDVSWSAKSRVSLEDYGDFVVEDYGVSIGGTPDAQEFVQSNLVQAIGALMNNPWKPVLVKRIDMELELRYAREILQLRGAEVLEPEVDAGKDAHLRLRLVRFDDQDVVRDISIPIPLHLAGQRLRVKIAPGYATERDSADPESVEELIRILESPTYPAKAAVVSYESGAGAVAYRGVVARNLPPGAVDLLRQTTSSVTPEAFKTEVRHLTYLDDFMVGRDEVALQVKPVLR